MADITASMVKELRERTQAGMADCKSALVEAGGDMDKAVDVILKKGVVKAASRAGRVASEGEVATWVAPDEKRAVVVEINSQTDFVSRGDDFKNFVKNVLSVATKSAAGTDLGTQKYPGTDKTIDVVRQELISKTGENIVIRRWAALEAKAPGGIVHSYVHQGGKLAVLLHAEGPDPKNAEFRAFIDNVAMQTAAMNALVVRREEIAAGRHREAEGDLRGPAQGREEARAGMAQDHRGQGRQVVQRGDPPRAGQRMGPAGGDHRQAPPGARQEARR